MNPPARGLGEYPVTTSTDAGFRSAPAVDQLQTRTERGQACVPPPGIHPVLLHAAAVLPMDGPALLNAGVVVGEERILAVGETEYLRRAFPGIAERAFPTHVLMPGLVNAHTHLELTYMQGRIAPPAHFTRWVADLMAAYPPEETVTQVISAAVAQGRAASLRSGVTTVGDISRQCAISRAVLREGPLQVVSFGEMQAIGRRRHLFRQRLAAALDPQHDSPALQRGLSPHAPYTVEGPYLQQCVAEAERGTLPICMHLAELHEEAAFLADLSGPLGRAWDVMLRLDILDEAVPTFAGGPIRWAKQFGLLGAATPVLLAHVNYCDDAELALLAANGVSVAYCPRTWAYFGHPANGPHPWRRLRAAGVNVCLGTDSLASNPDLAVLREAQFLAELHPDEPPENLLAMITRNGAVALGLGERVGRLKAGFAADVIALPLPPAAFANRESVARMVVQQAPAPDAVMVRGQWTS